MDWGAAMPDFDADYVNYNDDRNTFLKAFGPPPRAKSLSMLAPRDTVYLRESVIFTDPKTGAVYSARKGRIAFVLRVESKPGEGARIFAAFRAIQQTDGLNNHARANDGGFHSTGKEAEIG